MRTGVQAQVLNSNKSQSQVKLLEKIKGNGELIAAIVCGVFILLGWLLQREGFGTSVIFFIFAFVIGGFAKAKEGIEETIANKELNVEMLMILAAIGSAIIGYWIEGAILIFIFALSGALETYTMNKSNKEILSLMELQPKRHYGLRMELEERVNVLDND